MLCAFVLPLFLAAAPLPAKPAATPGPKAPAEVVPPAAPAETSGKAAEIAPPSIPLSPGTTRPAPPPPRPADGLSESELDEILRLLRERYVPAGALSATEVKRATVQGLLERLGARASLRRESPAPTAPAGPAVRAEVLPGHIGYVRVDALSPEALSKVDGALTRFRTQEVAAQVLDLRALPPGSDLPAAAELCRRWSGRGKTLFTVQRPGGAEPQAFRASGEPSAHGLLLVLTAESNAGAAELIAGALRLTAGAVLIGERTRGEAAEMAEERLASGAVLRYAVAEVRLGENTPLGPEGVQPDLLVEVPPGTTTRLLAQEAEGGVESALNEPERARLNEAALVAGRNPELEAAGSSSRLRVPSAPRDAVLQRALDLAISAAVFEKR